MPDEEKNSETVDISDDEMKSRPEDIKTDSRDETDVNTVNNTLIETEYAGTYHEDTQPLAAPLAQSNEPRRRRGLKASPLISVVVAVPIVSFISVSVAYIIYQSIY